LIASCAPKVNLIEDSAFDGNVLASSVCIDVLCGGAIDWNEETLSSFDLVELDAGEAVAVCWVEGSAGVADVIANVVFLVLICSAGHTFSDA
jgi:hypothetical protein